MSTQITASECGRKLQVSHTRGDRLAITVRIDGDASASAQARLDAWSGSGWLAQVRSKRSADDATAEFEVTEAIEDNVGLWAFVIEDTEALEASKLYYFDFQLTDGPLAPYTYFAGSTLYIDGDASREGGS